MSKIPTLAWAAMAAIVGSTLGCGGRTSEDPTDNGYDPSNPLGPAPTCDAICRAAVDQCAPGAAITQCTTDCEAMRTKYQGCPALDAFLRCMPKVPVICTPPSKVEFNGCNDERDALSRCP